jgi:hypothetical protein
VRTLLQLSISIDGPSSVLIVSAHPFAIKLNLEQRSIGCSDIALTQKAGISVPRAVIVSGALTCLLP